MPLLQTRKLTKEFDGVRALEGLSIAAEAGEILGIIGPNGAGKTTLFNIVTGIFPPTAGEVLFRDRPIHHLRPFQVARLGIARTFQVVRPFPNLDLIDNVLVAYGHRFYPRLAASLLPSHPRDAVAEAERLLDRVGLLSQRHLPAGSLPLGFKKRLEIARALALDPMLLLLDEPSGGLRFEESRHLMALIQEVNVAGITVIIIEHNMPLVMDLCRRLVVLDHGVLIAEGSPEAIRRDPQVIEAYLGRSGV